MSAGLRVPRVLFLGLYGTLSYVVNLRRREVGLRLALGAVGKKLVGQYLVQALRVVVMEIVAGLVLSFFFTRLLAGMLYGVSPGDPVVLATVVAIVLVVATVAALIPAMRAALVEPMQVLREGLGDISPGAAVPGRCVGRRWPIEIVGKMNPTR